MKEYVIQYKLKHEKHVCHLFGHDRLDAINYFRRHVSKKGKVVSARAAKTTQLLPKLPPKPKVLTEREALEEMTIKAMDKIKANPYDGKAIGNYLRLELANERDSLQLKAAVTWLIRQIDNYTESFTEKKY